MADYIITLDDDQDASIGTPDYNIGVNYEIPSKSVQYQNLILDSIASQFDGTKLRLIFMLMGNLIHPSMLKV